MIALLGPEIMAQQLAEMKRIAEDFEIEKADTGEILIRRREALPPPPPEPIMLSGRPGTNRHARRARAAMARRKR